MDACSTMEGGSVSGGGSAPLVGSRLAGETSCERGFLAGGSSESEGAPGLPGDAGEAARLVVIKERCTWGSTKRVAHASTA